jgi:hypothetical protein
MRIKGFTIMHNVNKLLALMKHVGLLDKEEKRRFDDGLFSKNIVVQGDVLHATIQTQVPIIMYLVSFCGITPPMCFHNMKVAMERRKVKPLEINKSSLYLVEPPWVYKPMPYSMPIL